MEHTFLSLSSLSLPPTHPLMRPLMHPSYLVASAYPAHILMMPQALLPPSPFVAREPLVSEAMVSMLIQINGKYHELKHTRLQGSS